MVIAAAVLQQSGFRPRAWPDRRGRPWFFPVRDKTDSEEGRDNCCSKPARRLQRPESREARRCSTEADSFLPRGVRQGEDMLLLRSLVFLAVAAIPVGVAATVNGKGDARESLWTAVRMGDPEGAQALLDKGADVNA